MKAEREKLEKAHNDKVSALEKQLKALQEAEASELQDKIDAGEGLPHFFSLLLSILVG